MKRTIAALLLIISCTFAQNNSGTNNNQGFHSRRGLYFSTSSGTFYTYANYFSEEISYDRVDKITSQFASLLSYGEIRLGASIANWPSLYAVFGMGLGIGNYRDKIEFSLEEYSQKNFTEKNDIVTRTLVGLGGEYNYPFQDNDDFTNGLFFGTSAGFMLDLIYHTEHDVNEVYDNMTSAEFGGFFFRFEIGKDWWISQRWSLGVALNYTFCIYRESTSYSIHSDKESLTGHSIGLMFRITR